MAKLQDVEAPYLTFAEGTAPGTPTTALVVAYAKADGKLYIKDDAGTETDLTSGGGGGGGSGMTLIDSWDHSIDGNTDPIEFSSIPDTYDQLRIVVRARGGADGSTDFLWLRFGQTTVDEGSTDYAYDIDGSDNAPSSDGDSKLNVGRALAGTGSTAGLVGFAEVVIDKYADTGMNRFGHARTYNRAIGTADRAGFGVFEWINATDPIDIIRLYAITEGGATGNFIGGIVELYGI